MSTHWTKIEDFRTLLAVYRVDIFLIFIVFFAAFFGISYAM